MMLPTLDTDEAGSLSASSRTGILHECPCWIGAVMGFLLPGVTHVLAGKVCSGLRWFFGYQALLFLCLGALSIPGCLLFWLAIILVFVFLWYQIAVIISSWQPVHRNILRNIIYFLPLYVIFNCLLLPTFYGCCIPRIALVSNMGGYSMSPTLTSITETLNPKWKGPDRIVVNRWFYYFFKPQRGEIVEFNDPFSNKFFVKRVVGLPSETIDIQTPYVLVNDKRLTEPEIFSTISSTKDGHSGYFRLTDIEYYQKNAEETGVAIKDELPITLGPDEYYLLGDNSINSHDSRLFGPVKRSSITGRVVRIVYPFSRTRGL